MSVALETEYGQVFQVPREVAMMSVTIANMLADVEDDDSTDPIMLPNLTGPIMAKVVEWAKHHHDHPDLETKPSKNPIEDPIPEWDQEFLKVEQSELFDIMIAANYLDIKPLLNLTCKTVALMIRGKSPEDIRKQFNIKNDFTPEEEEQIRKENEWCMDL
jgi:S-phase kinase-associated protein 1